MHSFSCYHSFVEIICTRQSVTMVSCTKTKYKRTCPICSYNHLSNLPSHLKKKHMISAKERKQYLQQAITTPSLDVSDGTKPTFYKHSVSSITNKPHLSNLNTLMKYAHGQTVSDGETELENISPESVGPMESARRHLPALRKFSYVTRG